MFPSSATSANERGVRQRRLQEQKNNELNGFLKTDRLASHSAQIDNRANRVFTQNFIQKRLNEKMSQHEEAIDQRRIRLRQLYNSEFAQWQKELEDIQDNPTKMKQRMIDTVTRLREEKEKLRTEFVKEKLEQQFREGADELRKVDSTIREHGTTYERDIQMMEKQKQLRQKFEEEMIYADLWKRDIARKEKVERQKEEAQRKKVDERNQILGRQLQTMELQKQEVNMKKDLEKEMLVKELQ